MIQLMAIAFVLMQPGAAGAGQHQQVDSPDGKIRVTFQLEGGTPTYAVAYDGKVLIKPSRLGYRFARAEPMTDGFAVSKAESRTFDETWKPVWGTASSIRNHYNELTVSLEQGGESPRQMSLIIRAYDDGAALRYAVPEQANLDNCVITSEETRFNFAGDYASWWIPADFDSHELLYRQTPLSEVKAVNTPITMQTAEGICLSIHEADLTDYADMTLKAVEGEPLAFQAELVPWADGMKVKTRTPFRSPWRTIQISPKPGGLIESHLILNLNEPCKIEDTSWIKPMKYVGIWWGMHIRRNTWYQGSVHGATTGEAIRHINFAAEHNIPGVLIEGWNEGWRTWGADVPQMDFLTAYGDFDLNQVAAYAASKGVALIGHHETSGNVPDYERQMEAAFALYEKLGITAVKTGYAGTIHPKGNYHHGQLMVRHYQKVVELAAQHRIMIDAHEPIKPTGIERTWPNMMTREGVRGMEYNAWSEGNPPEHTAILPFTRMLAGPADYTPGIFDLKFDHTGKYRVYTTLAKQLALYVVLYSPLQMAADLIENYEGHPAFAFIEAVPVTWDETRVLDGAIGDHVTIARRSGDEWYLGSLTDEHPRRFDLALSFLKPDQTYAAHVFADSAKTDYETAPGEVEIGRYRVTQADTLPAVLCKSGGMAVRFSPVDNDDEAAKLSHLKEFARNADSKWKYFNAVATTGPSQPSPATQPAVDPLSTANRGERFAKKKYDQAALPSFEEFKQTIPVPVLGLHSEWLEMYWKCWDLAHKHLRQPKPNCGFVSNYLDEAFSDNIFQWDTVFMVLFARYNHFGFPAIESLDNFYAKQREDGYICREIKEDFGTDFVYLGPEHTVNPPLFGWAELESYRISGDKTRLGLVLPVLEKYAEWLETGRKKPGTAHGLFWNTGLGSGMDNTPRRGSGWTDMSCQMVMLYNAMADMSEVDAKSGKGTAYRTRANQIAEGINRWMWNEQDGLYYDVDDAGKQLKCKTVACFWPLVAGVADKARAERLAENLKDSRTFWTPLPFPSLAADDASFDPLGGYWKGGVWAPTNVAIIKGLERYGYHDFAAHATVRYLTAMYSVFQQTGTVWENYAPVSFAPGKPSRSDFVGWSGCGPIALLIENVVGVHCDAGNNRLTWYLRRTDRHGIENLRFGDATVKLICAQRTSPDGPATLTVESNRDFELHVELNNKMHQYRVKKGKQEIAVP